MGSCVVCAGCSSGVTGRFDLVAASRSVGREDDVPRGILAWHPVRRNLSYQVIDLNQSHITLSGGRRFYRRLAFDYSVEFDDCAIVYEVASCARLLDQRDGCFWHEDMVVDCPSSSMSLIVSV